MRRCVVEDQADLMMAGMVEACRLQDHQRPGQACPVADKLSQSQGSWAIRLFGLSKLGHWVARRATALADIAAPGLLVPGLCNGRVVLCRSDGKGLFPGGVPAWLRRPGPHCFGCGAGAPGC